MTMPQTNKRQIDIMKKSAVAALIAISGMLVPRAGAVWTEAGTWGAGEIGRAHV